MILGLHEDQQACRPLEVSSAADDEDLMPPLKKARSFDLNIMVEASSLNETPKESCLRKERQLPNTCALPDRAVKEVLNSISYGSARARTPRRPVKKVSIDPRVRELKLMLSPDWGVDKADMLMHALSRDAQQRFLISYKKTRDAAVSLVVMASRRFSVSTATSIRAITIFDKFMSKVLENIVVGDTRFYQSGESGQFEGFPKHFCVEVPLACFQMSCKFVEVLSPRLADVTSLVGEGCSITSLRSAELFVWEVLDHHLDFLTASDVLYKLLDLASRFLRNKFQTYIEANIKIALCCHEAIFLRPSDIAVGALIYTFKDMGLDDKSFDFIPKFMKTAKSEECEGQIKAFVAAVRNRKK
ncbi:hypothetical protein GUITHDRAFT_131518 [Guillardia theta CCMP2712]|uniref:Cyclin C-terminal domain-containing protein n=1 Tax=Guillardia theta (strain CCMP2712) TaxID=905079 RepID=L1K3Z4_GUITC|nr:hypothetical protein GUITHDRAFT_131518 [Guillardia theta CCMP2712]EKX55277.1 hypothetical protein GUITHDRAFT_131518 [Guillardia theta CCMP2712]|eukprot:XP_005842257.1 hypothetical protein GUITHDRAFT_131518 [Guillardia theta CCMP2712]